MTDSKLQRALVARANSTDPTALPPEFEPTPALKQIAAALATSAAKTWTELAESAGVSRSTVSRALEDPSSVRWLALQGTRLAEENLGAVHLALLEKALTSKNPSFLRLYLQRFDKDFQKHEIASHGRNQQTNVFEGMSPAELQKHVAREVRRLGLSQPADPKPDR